MCVLGEKEDAVRFSPERNEKESNDINDIIEIKERGGSDPGEVRRFGQRRDRQPLETQRAETPLHGREPGEESVKNISGASAARMKYLIKGIAKRFPFARSPNTKRRLLAEAPFDY